jgi:short-subunit dehydrogenase
MNALITGGSNGIGKELAKQFAKNKINVILVARDQKGLDSVSLELATLYGVEVKTIALDLSLPNAAQKIYDEIKKFRWDIDYLVNDAGFGNFGFFVSTDWEKEKSMIALNIVTLTQLCKLFIPDMVTRKHGKVLNLASTAAFQPGPLMAVYYATKAYVLSFSEAINNELRATGVTVTALCPGPTGTGFEKAANAEQMKLFKKKLPSPDKVALYGYKAMMNGKSIAILGLWNKILILSVRFAPRDMVTAMVRKMSEEGK